MCCNRTELHTSGTIHAHNILPHRSHYLQINHAGRVDPYQHLRFNHHPSHTSAIYYTDYTSIAGTHHSQFISHSTGHSSLHLHFLFCNFPCSSQQDQRKVLHIHFVFISFFFFHHDCSLLCFLLLLDFRRQCKAKLLCSLGDGTEPESLS